MGFTTSDNNFATAKWIVNATAGLGTHTTIATALTSASSGDTIFIMPGTYTENLTLKAGVNLAAYDCDALTPNVIISGKATFTGTGTVSISGIELQTNSDFYLAVTGSAASVVNLISCKLNASNNTGISHTSSNAASQISIRDCEMDLGTTGIAYWSSTSAGSLLVYATELDNSGGSSTAASSSAATVVLKYCSIIAPLSGTSTTNIQIFNCQCNTAGQNATFLTTAGSSAAYRIDNSSVETGSASAISIGTGTTLNIYNTIISSTNTHAITGAGSIIHGQLVFEQNQAMNVTTQTGKLTDSKGAIQRVYTSTSALVHCTTTIPYDDTIPQNTEGNQVLSVSITPSNTNSILFIQAFVCGACQNNANGSMSLFQDSNANASAATTAVSAAPGYNVNMGINYYMTAGTTSSTTFAIRCGSNSGNFDVNGTGANARIFGGAAFASLVVTEIGV